MIDVDVSKTRIVIPSLGRVDTVHETLAVFPREVITLVVNENEAPLYRKAHPDVEVLAHPATMKGLGKVRGWMLEHVPYPAMFMVDDDILGCWSVVGHRIRKVKDPRDVYAVVTGAARCAAEAGTMLFGFAQTTDARNFKAQAPFIFGGFINGNALGIVGRDPRIAFDPVLDTKQDVDISLQALLYYRILWRDTRFSFGSMGEFKHVGGNATFRTMEIVRRDTARLRAKWGKAVDVNHEERRTLKRDARGRLHRHVNIRIRVRRR